jgi:spermidine synthase
LATELKADPRIAVHRADVYARLLAPPTTRYDVILLDVDHSPDEHLGSGSAAFYEADGLRRAQQHLRPGGVLGVWSYAEHSGFSRAMHQVFQRVSVEPVTVFNDLVDEEQTDWLFFGCA